MKKNNEKLLTYGLLAVGAIYLFNKLKKPATATTLATAYRPVTVTPVNNTPNLITAISSGASSILNSILSPGQSNNLVGQDVGSKQQTDPYVPVQYDDNYYADYGFGYDV